MICIKSPSIDVAVLIFESLVVYCAEFFFGKIIVNLDAIVSRIVTEDDSFGAHAVIFAIYCDYGATSDENFFRSKETIIFTFCRYVAIVHNEITTCVNACFARCGYVAVIDDNWVSCNEPFCCLCDYVAAVNDNRVSTIDCNGPIGMNSVVSNSNY